MYIWVGGGSGGSGFSFLLFGERFGKGVLGIRDASRP